jgi:F-type H+-transporting ATPase subunit a
MNPFQVTGLAAANPLSHVVDEPLFHHVHDLVPHAIAERFSPLIHHLEGLGEHLRFFGLTKHVFMFLLAGLLTVLFFWSYARSAGKQRVPGRWGSFVESVILFLRDQILRPFLGEEGDKYLPIISTFFVYIAITNLLGLVPLFDFLGHGGNTATGSLAITAGLAICSFCMYHYQGIKAQGHGVLHYLKNQIPHVPGPLIPLMIVIELVAHIIRPCALAIRLFANMLAGHTMVAAILGFTLTFKPGFAIGGGAIAVISTLGVTAITFLELLVALVQALVFTFLTTVFLSMAVHADH